MLGWEKCRDIAQRYSLGVTEHLLVEAMDAGQLAAPARRALAHILIGALDEAAMVIATAEDRDQARADVGEVLRRLFDGLLTDPCPDRDTLVAWSTASAATCRFRRPGRPTRCGSTSARGAGAPSPNRRTARSSSGGSAR